VSEATAELGLDYLSDSNSANYNLNGLIMIFMQFLPFLIVYINAIKHMKDTEANYKIKRLFFQISFLLLYLAFCFWQTASNHLFLRFMNTCTLPMALALAFYMTDKRSTKLNKVFMGALALYYLLFTITSVI
jgi:hypothetical protein